MDSVVNEVENLDMPPVVEMKYVVPGPPPYYAAPVSPRAARPSSPRAGEAFIRQPESLAGMMNQWMAWDAKEQQLLRQNCNVAAGTRGVYTPAEVFAPKQLPQLAPVPDPRGLEAQIQKIEGQFAGVDFSDEEIVSRKAFLGRVEKQAADLMANTARKCALWHRQAVEYRSLAEYDAEIMRLRVEKKTAISMVGGKRRRKATDDMVVDS